MEPKTASGLLQSTVISIDRTTATCVALSSILSVLIFIATYRVLLHPLSRFPGPFAASITGLWRSKKYNDGKWHDEILKIHKQYGRIVRIAPNELSIVDEHAMKMLYGHGHNAPKTRWYTVWDPPNSTPLLFSELDKTNHAFLRKRVAGAYSMTSVLKYETHIQGCLDLLFQRLYKHCNTGGSINMSTWTNAFAFDVIGELAYGSDLGHLRTESDVDGLRRNIFTIFRLMSVLGHFPGQMAIANNPVTRWLSACLGKSAGMPEFQAWSTERIQDRLSNPGDANRNDLLSHFSQMKGKDGNGASSDEILVEALNLIGAGADTTSIGMRACLYYLALNPESYKLVQKEVDAFYEGRKLHAPITYLQTQQLPYLQAVIKEATRLFPSIVYQLLRYAPPDLVIRGQNIPEGTEVGISPIAQNRDRDIWGPDADEFRPQRWLENEERAKYYDKATMTFGGSGPRMCVGKNVALVELNKFIAQIIRYFDFELADRNHPWRITSYWFAFQHDLFMHLHWRGKEFTSITALIDNLAK
ncbi:cytochrome P450 [Ilyonectria destructans]|nr:cytochrome P450 [Ilyonectria destructans]